MCGIIGYIGKEDNALDKIIGSLEHLEYRGYDSSGIAYITDNKLNIIKEKGRIKNLKKGIDFNNKSSLGIAHTRWATHGEANKINAHPHKCGKITIVHNGIIENYNELKIELSKLGYKFISETDTEVACALFDSLYNKYKDINKMFIEFEKKVKGAYAIGLIIDDDYDNLYAIRKNSPLIIGLSDDENFIASDMPAILDYTKKYIVLDDGDFAKICFDNIDIFDKNGIPISKKIKTFEGDENSMDKGNYNHFMEKEIYEQPDVIRKTSNNIMPDFKPYKKINIVACGSAMHAGLIGKSLIEEYGNIPVDVDIASEFRYKKLFLDKDTLVIAISQSGETADTLEAVKIAKSKGCDTLGIINVKESSIAREVDNVIYTDAGSEIAVATTKGYTSQVEVLAMIAHELARRNDDVNKLKEFSRFLLDIKRLPLTMKQVLERNDEFKDIALDVYNKNDIFFIGRGIDYGIAMEGSLKLKEISYLHSEAYPAGELKHGTISLIEDGTPVFGIVTDKKVADKTISNLKEVKSRGAYVIYVTTKDLDTDGDFYDKKVVLPSTNPFLQPVITILPLQLIAYNVARLNNCDIDKPKNLAKSVTVE